MAGKKERFIGQGAKSVPDPGLDAMKARVAEQRAARAKEREAAATPAEADDALLAMRHRTQTQKDAARQQHLERDTATAAAAKRHLASVTKDSGKKSTTTGD